MQVNQTTQDTNLPLKDQCAAVFDASKSDESKSTVGTKLGKRSWKQSSSNSTANEDQVTKAFVNDKNYKRAKVSANVVRRTSNDNVAAVVAPSNLIQIKCGPVQVRELKSAPTSFNGSTNLNPTLDINVSLPVGVALNSDDSSVSEEGSCDRKERR